MNKITPELTALLNKTCSIEPINREQFNAASSKDNPRENKIADSGCYAAFMASTEIKTNTPDSATPLSSSLCHFNRGRLVLSNYPAQESKNLKLILTADNASPDLFSYLHRKTGLNLEPLVQKYTRGKFNGRVSEGNIAVSMRKSHSSSFPSISLIYTAQNNSDVSRIRSFLDDMAKLEESGIDLTTPYVLSRLEDELNTFMSHWSRPEILAEECANKRGQLSHRQKGFKPEL